MLRLRHLIAVGAALLRVHAASLTPEQWSAPLRVEIDLRMRNRAELQSRIERGVVLSAAELEAGYFPLLTDQTTVTAWLRGQGLQVDPAPAPTLSLFAEGSVATVARVFQVRFDRVGAGAAQRTAAVTAPILPAAISAAVLAINGLDPVAAFSGPVDAPPIAHARVASAPYTPRELFSAYQVPTTADHNGQFQVIAMIADSFPSATDLNGFWSYFGINRTGTLTLFPVGNGPTGAASTTATAAAEWATSVAPAANLNLYGLPPGFTNGDISSALAAIYSSARSNVALQQVVLANAYSLESLLSASTQKSIGQWFQALAALGVNSFCPSGNFGSQPAILPSGSFNDPLLGTPTPWYPSSDPNVIAVGTSNLGLDTDGSVLYETASSASGGGHSASYARPSWQVAPGAPSGADRLVPDVSLASDRSAGAWVYYQNKFSTVSGGSFSAAFWGGICALISQSRRTAGLPPLGSLNAQLYPLAGTDAFHDIIQGSTGAYSAGPGYDLCTGLGTPNVSVLLSVLAGGTSNPSGPEIVSRGGTVQATPGDAAAISVVATGPGTLSYNWQRLPAGAIQWTTLIDNSTFSGTTGPVLRISAATDAMNGDSYRCNVTASRVTVVSPLVPLVVSSPATVTTWAGVARATGNSDGAGSQARFKAPSDIAIGPSGTLYVADSGNNVIRAITPAGVVSTLAGTAGVAGAADGQGTAATFKQPFGLAVDSKGNVFVADTGNNEIRKVTPQGVVSTYAGTGKAGNVDGIGSVAQFSGPISVAVDTQDNVFVADDTNAEIRKISANGIVSTFAGSGKTGSADGVGTAAQFVSPLGLAFGPTGDLFVSDDYGGTIRKITPAGAVTTLVGTSGYLGIQNGVGASARLDFPSGLSVDPSGTIYLTDVAGDCIYTVSQAGVVGTIAGLPGSAGLSDGTGSDARFGGPNGVAIDPSGTLYVADSDNDVIRRLVLPPRFTVPPSGRIVTAGSSTTLTAGVAGSQLSYQWLLNGTPLAGATQSTLVLSGVQSGNAGQYTVKASNSAGTVTSDPATVTVVTPSSSITRLVNLSTRSSVGINGNSLVVGFVSNGGSKRLLVRGVGPTLAVFGVPGSLSQPELTLFDSTTTKIDVSDGWGGGLDLSQIFALTGAFALPPSSGDAALDETVPAGLYTAEIDGANATTGVALAEIYDADGGTPPARLVNLSARAYVGTGADHLVAGFVVSGTGTERLLIRGIGPTLAGFGLPGTLPTTRITVYDQTQTAIADNSTWGGAPALIAAMKQVGAFPLSVTSADSAVVITVGPGNYTAELQGAGADTGVGLLEVYELGN